MEFARHGNLSLVYHFDNLFKLTFSNRRASFVGVRLAILAIRYRVPIVVGSQEKAVAYIPFSNERKSTVKLLNISQ